MSATQVVVGTLLTYLSGISIGFSVGVMKTTQPGSPESKRLIPVGVAAAALLFSVGAPFLAAGLQ